MAEQEQPQKSAQELLPIRVEGSVLNIFEDGREGEFVEHLYVVGSVEDALQTIDEIMRDKDGFDRLRITLEPGWRIVDGDVLYSSRWL